MENEKSSKKGIVAGVIYGLIPHIGCIAFVIFTILGITALSAIFRPFLASRYSFPLMMILSFMLAGISALFYLRKNCCVNKKRYLVILFSAVIAVNLLMYFVIFPLLVNVSISGAAINTDEKVEQLNLEVDIPCSGHASLITEELKKIDGVAKVEYSPIKTFRVYYNPEKTSEKEILALEIFKEYNAVVKYN